MRKLATVRTIKRLVPIVGADKIECALIDGWQVVVRKGEFSEGSLCVYFEIDSVLPERECFEFMASRKYRVKTIKLRKCLSQGLAIPLEVLGVSPSKVHPGLDLTEKLGVVKYEVPTRSNRLQNKPKVFPWWVKLPFGAAVYGILFPGKNVMFPEFIPKTDENRVQNLSNPERLVEGSEYVVTEKLDGMSTTIFYEGKFKNGLFKKPGLFGVCSRNRLRVAQSGAWWAVAVKYNLRPKLKRHFDSTGQSLAIQGEVCGPNIQGNLYGLQTTQFFVYGIWDITNQRYLAYDHVHKLLRSFDLKEVPYITKSDTGNTCKRWLELAEGMSALNSKALREGIVIREASQRAYSFKAINNSWLLKHE